jgi:Spy/CpxP family protein refolding chaperone
MNRKATLLVIAVFVLGLALGALCTYWIDEYYFDADKAEQSYRARGREQQNQEASRMRLVERLTRELALTPDQQEQLKQVLQETSERYDSIYEEMRPRLRQAREDGRAKIRSFLTPEQREKFDAWLQKIDEERRKRECRDH